MKRFRCAKCGRFFRKSPAYDYTSIVSDAFPAGVAVLYIGIHVNSVPPLLCRGCTWELVREVTFASSKLITSGARARGKTS